MAAPGAAASPEVRVLVVDDSAFMRQALCRLVERTPGMQVAGTAADGADALRKVLALRPDVVTMDVEMPGMDGLSALAEIVRLRPTPVVMVSSLTPSGADTAIRALEAGAVECVGKPGPGTPGMEAMGAALAAAILRASNARPRPHAAAPARARPSALPPHRRDGQGSGQVVVVGASTGGPPALTRVIGSLPADLRAPVIVVQHMPAGFTAALARRLDGISALEVREAAEGDLLAGGRVLVAPGDHHLVVGEDRRVHLEQSPPVHGVRPAADITLGSVARVYGRDAVVAILTGMGRDGAAGARAVADAGGQVFVQDEASSVVYGMPRVTRELNPAARETTLERMAEALAASVRG